MNSRRRLIDVVEPEPPTLIDTIAEKLKGNDDMEGIQSLNPPQLEHLQIMSTIRAVRTVAITIVVCLLGTCTVSDVINDKDETLLKRQHVAYRQECVRAGKSIVPVLRDGSTTYLCMSDGAYADYLRTRIIAKNEKIVDKTPVAKAAPAPAKAETKDPPKDPEPPVPPSSKEAK